MPSLRHFAVAFAAVCAWAGAVEARVIHVQGREGLSDAIRAARPGDVVLLARGTYDGGVWVENSGEPGRPITIRGEGPIGSVVVRGGGEGISVGDGAHDLVFERFELRDSDDNLFHVQGGAHDIVLRDLVVHDAGHDGDGIKVNQAHDITLERVECFHPGDRPDRPDGNPAQECIDLLDVQHAVVRDSFLHDGGNMLLYAKGGSRDVVFERNVIAGQGDDAIDPCVGLGASSDAELLRGSQYEAERVVFRDNVVARCRAGAVGVYDAHDVWVLNNTFVDDGARVVQFRAGNGPRAESRAVRLANNVFSDDAGGIETPIALLSHEVHELDARNNLYWNGPRGVPHDGLSDPAREPGAIVADPGISAPERTTDRGEIVRLATPTDRSPLVDRGVVPTGAELGTDLAGRARVAGSAPDLGALETTGRSPVPLAPNPNPVAPPAGVRGGGPVRGCASGCTVGTRNPARLLPALAIATVLVSIRRRKSATKR